MNPDKGCFRCDRAYFSTTICQKCKAKPWRACAICDANDDIRTLCDTHRRDPSNKGWRGGWPNTKTSSTLDESAGATLAAVNEQPARVPVITERRIIDLSIRGLRVRTKRADGRGYYYRYHDPTYREIASEVQCSVSWVYRVLHRSRFG